MSLDKSEPRNAVNLYFLAFVRYSSSQNLKCKILFFIHFLYISVLNIHMFHSILFSQLLILSENMVYLYRLATSIIFYNLFPLCLSPSFINKKYTNDFIIYANQISHSNFQIQMHQNTFLFVHIHFYPHLIPANYLMQNNYFLSFLYFLGNNLLFPYT